MSLKDQSQKEACNNLNGRCGLDTTWQLACLLMALYKHWVNIQTNIEEALSHTSNAKHTCIPIRSIMGPESDVFKCPNKHFKIRDKSSNFRISRTSMKRNSLKVPWRSCINHAIIINAYSKRLHHSASQWEIRGSPDCDKTQLIVMSFFFFVASCTDKTSLN